MKRRISLLCVMLLLTGCGAKNTDSEEGDWKLYYVNQEEDQLLTTEYEPEAEDAEAQIQELIRMQAEPSELPEDAQLLLPEGTEILDYKLEENLLTLDFSSAYDEMDTDREILARAGLVRTFVQIPEVSRVQFEVDGKPLQDSRGEPVGVMTQNSFVENAGKNIHSYQNVTMQLYFADPDGAHLAVESRNVYYSSNVPVERVVIEELMKGPSGSQYLPTLSSEINLLSVTVQDGICYVNFDETFVTSASSVSARLEIYSMVNSISSVCGVEKVQFSVNGSTSVKFRQEMSLDQLYEPDFSLLSAEQSQ